MTMTRNTKWVYRYTTQRSTVLKKEELDGVHAVMRGTRLSATDSIKRYYDENQSY